MEQYPPETTLHESPNDRLYRNCYYRLMENLNNAIDEEVSNQ